MNTSTSNQLNRILLVVLLGFVVLQTSCKKEEKDILNGLNGTVWKGTYIGETWREEMTIMFQESTCTIKDKVTEDTGETYTDTYTGTYDYSPPDITIQFFDDEGNDGSLTGTISGNKITFYNDELGALVFTKQ